MLDRTKAPATTPFGQLVLPPETVITLDNGLTVHLLSGGNEDVARMSLVAEGGTSDIANPCVASFAAELLREGTVRHTSDAIADTVDFNGAWLNSSASSHFTNIQLSGLSSTLDTLAPLVAECFAEPSFPERSFEVIKSKGIARQQLNLSRVSFLASAATRRMMAGDAHPDATVPMPDDIAAISRDSIIGFHRSIINAAHTHAYICGMIPATTVDRMLAILSALPAYPTPSPMNVVPYAPQSPCTERIDKRGSLQAAVSLSLPVIGREHPDYNALRMTVTALGGYFGSRLMTNIREDKGYTYGISASLLGSREGSYVTIAAQCDNAFVSALIDETRRELAAMADCPLTDDEMTRLKYNVGTDLASVLDTPMSIMDYYELQRTVGVPADYFEARQRTLQHLTPDTVCEMARRYLQPDNLRIAVAGDSDRLR